MDIGEQETKYDINGAANATDPLEGPHPADAVTSVHSLDDHSSQGHSIVQLTVPNESAQVSETFQ